MRTLHGSIINPQERDTLDLELQHRFLWGERHDVSWGMGYRLLRDHLDNNYFSRVLPDRANNQLFSLFLQDDLSLFSDKLILTLGAKLQHNDFSGWEGQPSIRLLWTPNIRHTWWAAASRAVRTPNRGDCCSNLRPLNLSSDLDSRIPFSIQVQETGNPWFKAEKVWTYELGYRFKPGREFSLDFSAFHSQYSDLRGWRYSNGNLRLTPFPAIVLQQKNQIEAEAHGVEVAAEWQAHPDWKLQAAYSWLKTDLSSSPSLLTTETGTDPRHQAWLRSSLGLSPTLDLDLWLRYVARLSLDSNLLAQTRSGVPAYLTLDARLAWRPLPGLELAAVGQNLLDNQHQEFTQEVLGPIAVSVPRSFYLQANWRF